MSSQDKTTGQQLVELVEKMFVTLFANHQFILFLFVCGVAAAINFSSRILLGLWLAYIPSIIVAYILGIITAYPLCRVFVFQAKKNNPCKQIFFFCLVNVFAILLTTAVSVLLATHVLLFIQDSFTREEVAHFIGIMAPAFTSFIGHRYLSFR